MVSLSWTREYILRQDGIMFSLHISASWFLKRSSSICGDNYMGNLTESRFLFLKRVWISDLRSSKAWGKQLSWILEECELFIYQLTGSVNRKSRMVLLSKGYLNVSHQCTFDTGQGKTVNEKTCCAAASMQSLCGEDRQIDKPCC